MTRRYRMVKRVIDVVFSGVVLAASSPGWLVIAALIKRDDGGPVFYRGQRAGKDGDPFLMYKFRTMLIDAERLGGPSTAADDARLTDVGQVLRRWKLDELPQFLNVFRGEMSLVGPRPQVLSDVARYSQEERRLLSAKPGITDWSSIRFHNEGEILAGHADPDEAYDRLIRPEKLRLGLSYVDSASLRTDLQILRDTVLLLVAPRRGEPLDRS